MVWMPWVGWVVVVLALVMAGLNVYGARRWSGRTRALVAKLEAGRVAAGPRRYDARELDGLPPPVQRYFRAALEDGQPFVAAASVAHVGRFNMGQTRDQWRPFTSQQRVVTRRPGFVWDGRIAMWPGLPVRVHDAYVAGEGVLQPALLGLFMLMDLRGTDEVARGELMRYLAEAAWYPTALLPSQGVRWEAVDERSAQATLTDGALSLTLQYRFDDLGMIESVRAPARGRMVGKDIVMTPWEGRWSDYQHRDGMRVPFSGEVAWLTAEGRKPYWRGTITSLDYEFVR